MNKKSSLLISQALAAGAPSAEHKRFKTLLEKTEKARAQLLQWQEQVPLFAQSWRERVLPESERLAQARRAWALQMEQLLLGRKWSRADEQTLKTALVDLCETLLARDPGDEAMKALFNRHSEVDFDRLEQEELAEMKGLLEHMGDLDLGDEAPSSADELLQRAQEQMAQRMAAEREAADGAQAPHQKPPRARKPSKAEAAARLSAEEDARQASKTVRDVYRKLAGALHPDRTDAAASAEQRAERTALMQVANAAYEAGDLLALLTLQLQIEQVNTAHAAHMAATQVRHFNKVLAEQLQELQDEIEGRQEVFEMNFGLMTQGKLDPMKLGRVLKDVLGDIEETHAALAIERRLLSGDPATAKRCLKQLRARQQYEHNMDDFF